MNSLKDSVAQKTGLSRYDIDAILKIAFHQILLDIREGKTVYIEGFGFFAPKIMDLGLEINVMLNNSAKETLQKDNKRDDYEIILK